MGARGSFDDEINSALQARRAAQENLERSRRRADIAARAEWIRRRPERERLAAERAQQRAWEEAGARRIAAAHVSIDERLESEAAKAVSFLRRSRLRPTDRFIPAPPPEEAHLKQRRIGKEKGWVVNSISKRWMSSVSIDRAGGNSDGSYGNTIEEVEHEMVRVSGVALCPDGKLYTFDSGAQRTKSWRKNSYYPVETVLFNYLTAQLDSYLLLQYASANEMINSCPIVDKGQEVVSIDDQRAVNKLLKEWHRKLVDFTTNVAWNARKR